MKKVQNISSGPMADIAFLLLLFFLVTTTFEQDKGVKQNMMPLYPVHGTVQNKQTATIAINANDQLRYQGLDVPLVSLCHQLQKTLHKNNGQVVFEIKSSTKASYPLYVAVHSEIKKGYDRFYNEEAFRTFNKPYSKLSITEKKHMQSKYPKTIREVVITQ